MTEQEFTEAKRDYPGKWQQAQQSAAELGYRLFSDAFYDKARELFIAYGGRPSEKCQKGIAVPTIPSGFQYLSVEFTV